MPRPPLPRTSDDQGMTLVEVLVALAILAIVMPALAAVTFSTLRATQVNDQRTVATNVAQTEIERARTAEFPTLLTALGRTTRTQSVGTARYLVVRDTAWTGIDTTTDPCASPAGSAPANQLLRIDVEVWPESAPERVVRTSTTVARPSGDADDPTRGALGIQILDHQDPPQGVSGAVVVATRAGTPATSVTRSSPASGCVVFTDLPAGNYSITVSKPGYVGRTHGQPATQTRTATVVAGQLQVPPAVRAARGATAAIVPTQRFDVVATLPTTLPFRLERDALVLRGSVGTSVTGLWPDRWNAWAGDCPAADPLSWPGAQRTAPTRLSPGPATTAVPVEFAVARLSLPAGPEAPITWPVTVVATADDGCTAPDGTPSLSFPPIGSPGTTAQPSAVDLGLPYGRWILTATDAAGRVTTAPATDLPPTATGPVPVAPEPAPGPDPAPATAP